MLSQHAMSWCLRRLEAFAQVTRAKWTEDIAQMYEQALDRMTDQLAMQLVEQVTMTQPALPTPAVLLWMAPRPAAPEQPLRSRPVPGLATDTGRPAQCIVVDAFMAAWERDHRPDQPPPEEWAERARRLATGEWGAHHDAEPDASRRL